VVIVTIQPGSGFAATTPAKPTLAGFAGLFIRAEGLIPKNPLARGSLGAVKKGIKKTPPQSGGVLKISP
jgi:hypothetical protein